MASVPTQKSQELKLETKLGFFSGQGSGEVEGM